MTPLPKTSDLDDERKKPSLGNEDKLIFQSLLVNLRYMADDTRVDISFALCGLAQHLAAPTSRHMYLLNYVLQYLKHTISHGFMFAGTTKQPLALYADLDFVDAFNRLSVSGAVQISFRALTAWSVKRQHTVVLSTCEVEYLAAFYASQETLWQQRLIRDI